MKKLLYLIMLLCICYNVKADVVLPDGYFKDFLLSHYPSCFYQDVNQVTWLNTSCSEITNEDSLDLSQVSPNLGFYLNLEGIQYFTSLKYLNCTYGDLVTSPPLPSSLIKLVIVNALNNQPYGSFPPNFLPNGLRYLDMNYNYMLAPPSWPDSLRYLNCAYNSIGTMPALPLFLDTLICSSQEVYAGNNNILTALPSLPPTLKYLDCSSNDLSALPALPASLTYLDCSQQYSRPTLQTFDFHLTALPTLPAGLLTLKCYNNRLSSLPLLPSSLLYLDCSLTRKFLGDLGNLNPIPNSIVYEGIDTLLPLPPSLQHLNCSYNKLSNLPALPATITYLNCGFNIYPGFAGVGGNQQTGGISSLAPLPPQIDTLNIEGAPILCVPRIPASLKSLVIGFGIACLPNPGNYTVSGYNIFSPPPFCDMFNNYSSCQYTELVSGNIYYDNNSNGIKDPGESYRPNVEVQLSNGQYGYTSDSGYYALAADPGNYTFTVVEPTLYAAVPASINYSLSS